MADLTSTSSSEVCRFENGVYSIHRIILLLEKLALPMLDEFFLTLCIVTTRLFVIIPVGIHLKMKVRPDSLNFILCSVQSWSF